MENQVVCPKCKRTITHNPTIDAAAKGLSSSARSITCVCSERITFKQISTQLRDQKTFGWRFKNWIRSFSGNRS